MFMQAKHQNASSIVMLFQCYLNIFFFFFVGDWYDTLIASICKYVYKNLAWKIYKETPNDEMMWSKINDPKDNDCHLNGNKFAVILATPNELSI